VLVSSGVITVARRPLWRDFKYARSTNQPARQDIHRARRIIVRQGFSGAFRARKRGVKLPALAFAPLVELLQQEEAQVE
jgi:hypothetical protein